MKSDFPGIRMAVSDDGVSADIYIYDLIGESSLFLDQFSAKDLRMAIENAGNIEELNVHYNSFGGNPLQGIAMYNVLKNSGKKINSIIDGIAASAATMPVMAGDVIEMKTGSLMFIHMPSMFSSGTVEDMKKSIEQLEATTEAAIDVYESKSGKSRVSISKMMKDETWLSATEAKNEGFADVVSGDKSMAMTATPQMLDNVKGRMNIPESVMSLVEMKTNTPTPTTKKEEPTMADSKPETKPESITMSVSDYEKLRGNQKPEVDEVQMATDDAVKAERQRVANIHAVCMKAGIDAESEKKFVDEGTGLNVVQMAAIDKMSATNKPPTDSDSSASTDKDAPYKKEYQEAVSGGVRMQSSEEEYVQSRRISEGKESLSDVI